MMCSAKKIFNAIIQKCLIYNALCVIIKSSNVTKASVCVEMMGLIGAGNNPMVGMTVAVAVAIEEACK